MSREQQQKSTRLSAAGHGSERRSTAASEREKSSSSPLDHEVDHQDQGRSSLVGDDRHDRGMGRSQAAAGRRSSFHDRLSSSHGSTQSKLIKMKGVFESLQEVNQEDEQPEGLMETAEALVSATVMNHHNSDYRLLVACCLVEVLRIFAPEPPYTKEQVFATFSLIIAQLRGLATAATRPTEERTAYTYHLLGSLATCESCVLLALMTNDAEPGGLEHLVEMFEVLLTGMRPEHSQGVRDLVLEILQLCIGELHAIPKQLLDALLMQLLPVTRNENPTSYDIASELLRVTLAKVQTPISHLVGSMLSGSGDGAIESELKEHALPLVYELHKVTPNMLTFILPEVAEQLKAEDVDVRAGACALLGRLFASNRSEYGVEKPAIWSAFLGRFIDADVGIRRTMVDAATMIILRKPALRKDLHSPMSLRLQDPDSNVRSTTVKGLIDLVHKDPGVLTKALLEAVGQRMKDKKEIIRQIACIGMAKAFKRHIGSNWRPSADYAYGVGGKTEKIGGGGGTTASKAKKGIKAHKEREPISLKLPSGELSSKLGWVPASVVKAMGFHTDWDLRAKVLHLLDEIIVPGELRDEARAAVLAHLRHGMDWQGKQGLTWILKDKRTMRGAVVQYLDARDAFKASKAAPADKALEVELNDKMALVAERHPSFSPAGKQLTLLRGLTRKQDKKIFRLLRTVCSLQAPHSVIAEARCELLKKVGTNTSLGTYLKSLCGRCSVLAMGTAGFQEVCLACRRGMEEGDGGAFLPPLGLLEAMVGVFPEQARGQEGHLAAVFLAAQENGYQDEMTRVLAVIGACRHSVAGTAAADGSGAGKGGDGEDDLPDGFLESLVALCTKEGTPSQAAAAVRALASLASLPDTDMGEAARFSALDALRETAAAAAAASAAASSGGAGAGGRSKASARGSRGAGGEGKGIGATGVASLAAFAREFPREFKRYEGQALAFALGRMSGRFEGGDAGEGGDEEEDEEEEEEKEEEDRKMKKGASKKKKTKGGGGAKKAAEATVSPACRTICASMELAANCLMTPARAGGSGGGGGGCDAEGVQEGWLKTVLALLQAEGQPEGRREMNRRERAELRLAGSTCVVRLCFSSTRMQALLTPRRWHSLAWTLLDPSDGVRAAFLREVCRGLDPTRAAGGVGGVGAGGAPAGVGGPSTLRFMAYLCLAANESESLKRDAKHAISKKVRYLRLVHERDAAAAASRAAAAAAGNTDDGDGEEEENEEEEEEDGGGGGRKGDRGSAGPGKARAESEKAMPEYVVPYAIHLLAHHPDFPANKDDKPRMKNIQRYLVFLLDPLIGGHGREADNLSMLLGMLDIITTRCQDALDPSSNRIHITARVARQILASRIRNQSNLQPYPGKFYLPTPLFQERTAASSPSPPSPSSSKDPADTTPLPGASTTSSSANRGSSSGAATGRRRSSASSAGRPALSPPASPSSASSSRRVRRRTSGTGSAGAATPGSAGSVGAREGVGSGRVGRRRSGDGSAGFEPREENGGGSGAASPGDKQQRQREEASLSRSRRLARRSAGSPATPPASPFEGGGGPPSPSLSPIAAVAPSPPMSQQESPAAASTGARCGDGGSGGARRSRSAASALASFPSRPPSPAEVSPGSAGGRGGRAARAARGRVAAAAAAAAATAKPGGRKRPERSGPDGRAAAAAASGGRAKVGGAAAAAAAEPSGKGGGVADTDGGGAEGREDDGGEPGEKPSPPKKQRKGAAAAAAAADAAVASGKTATSKAASGRRAATAPSPATTAAAAAAAAPRRSTRGSPTRRDAADANDDDDDAKSPPPPQPPASPTASPSPSGKKQAAAGGRKKAAPLTARRQQQEQREQQEQKAKASAKSEAKGAEKKKRGASAAGAAAGAAAAPAPRGRRAPAVRGAVPVPAAAKAASERGGRGRRGGGKKGGCGGGETAAAGEEEEEEEEDEALMALSRRRRAAMQE